MKRYINSNDNKLIHFTDLFDDISAIVYVDDIDENESIFIGAATDLDYSDYEDDDLRDLSKEEVRSIDDLYTIYRLNHLVPEMLSKKQKSELAKYYHMDPDDLSSSGIRVYLDNSDVAKILKMLNKHSKVYGPMYRYDDESKNFAYQHNLNLKPSDYAHIIHSLTVDECTIETPYKTFGYDSRYPGHELVVFNVKKDIELSNGDIIGNFKVYIKIDLSKTKGPRSNPIALISFHE